MWSQKSREISSLWWAHSEVNIGEKWPLQKRLRCSSKRAWSDFSMICWHHSEKWSYLPMSVDMHLIRLDLLPNVCQQNFRLYCRPTSISREESKWIAIDRALKKLNTEVATYLLQSWVLWPRPDRARFFVRFHRVKASFVQKPLKFWKVIKNPA